MITTTHKIQYKVLIYNNQTILTDNTLEAKQINDRYGIEYCDSPDTIKHYQPKKGDKVLISIDCFCIDTHNANGAIVTIVGSCEEFGFLIVQNNRGDSFYIKKSDIQKIIEVNKL